MSSGLAEGAVAALVATAVVEAAKSIHHLTPSVSDVAGGSAPRGAVRAGQLAGGVTALAIGVAIALVARDARPAVAVVIVALVLIGLYEWLHRRSGRG
jgi:hypothetical protein